jgi:hypothetical protein
MASEVKVRLNCSDELMNALTMAGVIRVVRPASQNGYRFYSASDVEAVYSQLFDNGPPADVVVGLKPAPVERAAK